jgi:hypothetical protein
MNIINSFLSRHPWIYVVLAFLVLITAWTSLISIAVKHTTQVIEVGK